MGCNKKHKRQLFILMKRKLFFLLIFVCGISTAASSQIIPPGTGKAVTASWFVLGLQQNLNRNPKWLSVTYLGYGTKSNPDNKNPFYKPSIIILNQEFYHPIKKHGQYSFAGGYYLHDRYISDAPYTHTTPSKRQEFRIYGRISYLFSVKKLKFSTTWRQEFRKFYNPDFTRPAELFQARTRLGVKMTIPFDKERRNNLVINSEQLFAISKHLDPQAKSRFGYKESRFALFYSHSLKELPLVFHVGYMNDLIGNHKPYSTHTFGVNLIWKNPFTKKKSAKL